MGIELHRPLCFFDLETTGVNVVSDRIVEIAILKLLPNGNKEGKTWLVNPGMPIPKGASDAWDYGRKSCRCSLVLSISE